MQVQHRLNIIDSYKTALLTQQRLKILSISDESFQLKFVGATVK